MKVFSLFGILVGLISTVFGAIEGNFLALFSSIVMSFGFVLLFLYSKDKSEKLMHLFAFSLAIYALLNLIRMFTEKGYF